MRIRITFCVTESIWGISKIRGDFRCKDVQTTLSRKCSVSLFYNTDDFPKCMAGGFMKAKDIRGKSIDEVNIGAFPMRPGDNQHELLADFIEELLNKHAVEIVEQVIPQKGTTLEVKNRVLIGVVKPDNPQYPNFINGTATRYYTGKHVSKDIPLNGIDYFAPYLTKEGGYKDLYVVKNVRTGQKEEGETADNLRIILELEYSHSLFDSYHKDSNISKIQPFDYTTLEEIYLS